RCASWKTTGFCSNAGYTMDMRKQYCGVACGYCNRDGTQTAAGGGSTYTSCVDKNANCASWAATGFCTNPKTSNSMKLLYCCSTCRPAVLATTSTTAAGSSTVTGSTTTGPTTTTTVAGASNGHPTMIFPALLLLAFFPIFDAQCTGNDAPQCASWSRTGFCSNAGYTMEMRKQYCGVACGFCKRDGSQTAAGGGSTLNSCVDKNANCASWAATGFCTNPATSNSMKLLYCCNTCRPAVLATTTTSTTGASSSTISTSTTTTTTTTTGLLRCASWKTTGFCSNAGYTMEMRKQYCGVACGFCNRDGSQTEAGGGSNLNSCVDKNTNCASWAATGFCTNPSTSNSMKLLYCCNTCRPAVFATTTTTTAAANTTTSTTTTTTTT
ncbi:hypothetical protein PFISCL1PPCAC_14355, partial [Pristionchus fissidentatus]